jgi:flavin reductase (DIM6/NTAB) family NADH-FMN oxidoreductase RutF
MPPIPGAQAVVAELFVESMASVCTPVSIVSTRTEAGQAYGTTVSAFASLSLDPPMVTISLDRESVLLGHVLRSGRIGINVLAHGQQDLATTFARSRPDKFEHASWKWDNGLPRIDNVASWLACEVERTVPGGDHIIVLGRVVHADNTSALPLIYARRVFGTHSELTGKTELSVSR